MYKCYLFNKIKFKLTQIQYLLGFDVSMFTDISSILSVSLSCSSPVSDPSMLLLDVIQGILLPRLTNVVHNTNTEVKHSNRNNMVLNYIY